MTARLAGRVVLVTGAASGIGRAVVARAAEEGARVAGIDVDGAGLESLAAATGAAVRVADVADADAITTAIDALAAELGPLHAVVANAGVLPAPAPVRELDVDVWHRVLATNLTGALLTFRAGLAHVADGGVLLATGSSLAIRPNVGQLPYVAAKAGLHALVRSLALELAPRGIRANVIAPGLTDTPMPHGVPGHVERALPTVPLGGLVRAEDVAAMAVHLMSDEARAITGTVLAIDGGRTAG